MLSRDKSNYFDVFARKRFTGPLDLRAPEDQFSTDDDIAKGLGARSPKIDQHIVTYLDAWKNGDTQRQIEAAKDLVDETTGVHKLQGVPLFAHPPVPHHFVEAIKTEVEGIPAQRRAAVIKDIVDSFEPSVRPGIAGQFASQFSRRLSWSNPNSSAGFDDDASVGMAMLGSPYRFAVTATGQSGGVLPIVDQRFIPLGGEDADEGTRRQDKRPPNTGRTNEPPREVHPPARDDRCEYDRSMIAGMRGVRGIDADKRRRLLEDIDRAIRDNDSLRSEEIDKLLKELKKKQQDLAVLNATPLNTPDCRVVRNRRGGFQRECKPGLGPVPDMINHDERLRLQEEIAKLDKEIADMRRRKTSSKLDSLKAQLRAVCAKLDKNAAQLVPAEEAYRQKCQGRLDPWPEHWGVCTPTELM